MVHLELIIAEDCSVCKKAEEELISYSEEKAFVEFKSVPQINSERNTVIVPSLFINGKLFSYGKIDKAKIDSKIKQISSTKE